MDSFKEEIEKIKNSGYLRKRKINYSPQDVIVEINKKKLISFASNDYLGLANNIKIKKTFVAAVKKYGVGSGSSPLIAGYSLPHKKLEKDIARYLGFESALVTNSGYLSNVGIINAVAERKAIIFQDRENHNSIIESSRLASTKLIRYKHLSSEDLKKKLSQFSDSEKKIIFIDSIFSMTGEISPLKDIVKISKLNKALLFVDDAHGFCTLNYPFNDNLLPNICSYLGIKKKDIGAYIGTFGKAVGTFGSFIAGSKNLIKFLIQKSKPYIYSTSLPPAIAEATRESLKIIRKEKKLHKKLYKNIYLFKKIAKQKNLKLNESLMPIQSITIGNPIDTMRIQESAIKNGLFIQGIRYPSVPKNCDKLRINITSKHTQGHIQKLVEFLSEELK